MGRSKDDRLLREGDPQAERFPGSGILKVAQEE